MNSMIHRVSVIAISALAFVAVGCAAGSTDPDEEQIASDGEEATASQQQSVSFGAISFKVTSAIPEDAASQLSAPAPKLYPPSCVTAEKDPTNPRVVHVTYNDCTGPFGLVHIDGDETVTFSQNSDGSLHAAIQDDGDLTANGKPVQHSAAADITISGEERDVAWKGSWTRQDAKGETVAHTSDLQIVDDLSAKCTTVNGSGVTNVGTREIDTSYDGVKVCLNSQGFEGCPDGSVVHTAPKLDKSVTIDFDGSAQAEVTGPKGHTFDVPLVCTP